MLPAPTDSDGDPVDNSTAASPILTTLHAMTSKSLYAVAAIFLSASLPLSACSVTDSLIENASEAVGASTPSPSAYPTPARLVTPEQAKSIVQAGQRLADGRTAETLSDERFAFDFCRDAAELSLLDAKAWSIVSQAERWEQSPSSQASPTVESARISAAFAQVVVLTPSPASMRWAVEKFERAETCAEYDDMPVKTWDVSVPGAALSLVRTHEVVNLVGAGPHTAMAGALVENLFLMCELDAATEDLAFRTATSCLGDMAQAVAKTPTHR